MATKRVLKKQSYGYRKAYPKLWAFFDAAFQVNSGGHASDDNFLEFTLGQLSQAEEELAELAYTYGPKVPSMLGRMADAGYNLFGQTRQNVTESPDDEQHRLLAFELLDTQY